MRYENLDVWRRGCSLSIQVYKSFKDCRDFGFRDQITRSVLSIPSNIAEGCERTSSKETASFFAIAKGSAGEFKTQAYIGYQIDYLSKNQFESWWNESEELAAMLGALIKRHQAYGDK